MLENFDISLPVLSMTGGIILFLVALQTVLQQSATIADTGVSAPEGADMRTALSPLAFPTIVAPYGIAAVIVFATLARGRHQDELVVAGLVLTILLLDWLAMLFAEQILRRVGTSLQVFGVVLSVTQIALGLQVILQSLSMMGLISPRGLSAMAKAISRTDETPSRCLLREMFDHTLHTWNALGDDACCRSAGDGLDLTPEMHQSIRNGHSQI